MRRANSLKVESGGRCTCLFPITPIYSADAPVQLYHCLEDVDIPLLWVADEGRLKTRSGKLLLHCFPCQPTPAVHQDGTYECGIVGFDCVDPSAECVDDDHLSTGVTDDCGDAGYGDHEKFFGNAATLEFWWRLERVGFRECKSENSCCLSARVVKSIKPTASGVGSSTCVGCIACGSSTSTSQSAEVLTACSGLNTHPLGNQHNNRIISLPVWVSSIGGLCRPTCGDTAVL